MRSQATTVLRDLGTGPKDARQGLKVCGCFCEAFCAQGTNLGYLLDRGQSFTFPVDRIQSLNVHLNDVCGVERERERERLKQQRLHAIYRLAALP